MIITIVPNKRIVPKSNIEKLYRELKKKEKKLNSTNPELKEIILDFDYLPLKADYLMTHLFFENEASVLRLTITSSLELSSGEVCQLVAGKMKP